MAVLLEKEMAVICYINEVINEIDKKDLPNKPEKYNKIGIHAEYVRCYTNMLELRGCGCCIVNKFINEDLDNFFKENDKLFLPYYENSKRCDGWYTLNIESLYSYKNKSTFNKNSIIADLLIMFQPRMNYHDSFYSAVNLFNINNIKENA